MCDTLSRWHITYKLFEYPKIMISQRGRAVLTLKKLLLNERITKLRESIVSARPEIFIERALIVTEAYKETEGQASAIRRAK